ncbi:MAG TPA: DNA-binding transcriptional regulator SoxS [Erwinia persicina]|uniref:DNA-binding transcriptional regulator SoxS n=1 Tax=Erwinia persicina TaxID=55211 RepID=A0A354AI36_9GAMM|nr:superoxide response transcriptional regulator SoxS [Erwinia persicina]AXU96725.1 AraC family transcriptional regulator [Erwinia persicina]MBC3944812.1 superoxide response transcriptional regulator SoxS [Erwinia persicina]MBD8108036.1 superoxide response transcriptional regulator SoxS [Erwinia persicina]MBD8169123.1 superoxide response transcriptional regulator SoxS [Erwinia persicina]MBD8211116.1 superoxide response transcriptional regulator SoxS [Erwinia persicina]
MHDDIISTLTDWIDSNLEKTLSIDEVAAKSGYSKWHLQRMFRSVTKQTLGGYIRERRLTLAAEALRLTQRPVFDIALQYGYDSQQTFSRVFRRQFAQTPTAYRHSMRRQTLQRSGWNFDCGDYVAPRFSPSGHEKACPTCS